MKCFYVFVVDLSLKSKYGERGVCVFTLGMMDIVRAGAPIYLLIRKQKHQGEGGGSGVIVAPKHFFCLDVILVYENIYIFYQLVRSHF